MCWEIRFDNLKCLNCHKEIDQTITASSGFHGSSEMKGKECVECSRCIFSFPQFVYGQISPGDLSNAHKDLEGMSNCTKCHVLGDKV